MNSKPIMRLFWCLLPLWMGLQTGCVSSPSAHRTAACATERATHIRKVVVLPLDVEVSELSAGGMTEKRADWTQTVAANLNDSISRLTPCHPIPLRAPASPDELQEIQALYRAITANQTIHSFYGPGLLTSIHGPLVYKLGSLEKITASSDADAALLLFVRDDYATGGRKAVAVVGALTGMAVRTGVTLASAALVDRDGTILWMNYTGANHGDLRTQEDADATVRLLFSGLPSIASR